MYKLFVALRYLRANKIIYFSIAGVGVGIMVMIIVTSVMGGFSRDIQARIRGLQAHLVVKSQYPDRHIERYDRVVEAIAAVPHVTGASPRIEWAAWMSYRGTPMDVVVIGVYPKREPAVSELPRFFQRGGKEHFTFTFDDGEVPEMPGVVAGSEVYAHPGVRFFLQTVRQGGGPMYLRGEFTVVGQMKSGMAEYDSKYLFMDLAAMQDFMKLAPPHQETAVVNTIAISLDDYDRNVRETRTAICEAIHGKVGRCTGQDHEIGYCGFVRVATWEQERSILLQAVAIERGIQIIILFCIVIVAGFNIIAIYTMMVRAKTRDVGILRSLGATRGGVTSIFLLSGGLCGLFGSLFGILMGTLIATNLNEIVGFVRITSREIVRAAYPTAQPNWSAPVYAGVLFLTGLILLVVAWTKLYVPLRREYALPEDGRRGFGPLRVASIVVLLIGLGVSIAGSIMYRGMVVTWHVLVVGAALWVADVVFDRLPIGTQHGRQVWLGWICVIATAACFLAGSHFFFGWAPRYERQMDDDPWIPSRLAWIVGGGAAGGLVIWNLIRWFTDPYRPTFFGGFIRIVGTILYSAYAVAFVAGLSVAGGILAKLPDRRFPGWDLFPRQIYYLDRVPVLIDVPTIVAISFATMLVSIVFSIYPAIRAATTDPIEAIRDE